MTHEAYYTVAGHRFCVESESEVLALMDNYAPFGCEAGETITTLHIASGQAPTYQEEMRQEDEGQTIICGRTDNDERVFGFMLADSTAGWLVSDADYRDAQLIIPTDNRRLTKFALDNALMVLYALATADKQTVLFHAAVVSCQGRGYMFLGPSGTGKSTHARLWLKHIGGTELVNDDNPVVRQGIVYGSPWSGKTPCYRNVCYPLGGIVVLSQAPYNRIDRLGGIEAYAALMSSISGMRWDTRIADGLHQSENDLAQQVPIWHLACLPDEEAATLCHKTTTTTL